MAGTSVKGAGTLLPAFTAGQGTVKTGSTRTETESFQSVWNRQTGPEQSQDAAKTGKKDIPVKETDAAEPDAKVKQPAETEKPKETGKPEETERSEEAGKPEETGRPEETGQSEEKAVETAGPERKTPRNEEEMSEEVLEVLQTAAFQLMEQIADAFGISTGQVQEMMEDLKMGNLDILQADKLGTLILAAGGAEDSLSLVTNETLYQNFQELMNGREEVLQGAAQELNVETQQLETMVSSDAGIMTEETSDISRISQDVEPESETEQLPSDNVQIQVTEALPEEDEETSREDGVKKPSGDMPSYKGAENIQEETSSVRIHSDSPHKQKQGQSHGHGSGSQQTGNPVLQQAGSGPEPSSIHAQHTSESSFSAEMDTENIMRQIMDYMKIRIKPDSSNLEMQLHPASLGTLQVQVASKGGVVTAQFITQNEAVKAVLESQMIQLKESFEQQGVKVEAIEVNVQAQQFDRNFDENRNGQPDSREGKNRTRRLRLDGDNGTPQDGELSGEEQLAVDIMAANGNTVDYTA